MTLTRYARFAWGVLAYNILVILWGAFVRATGSGAGCGSHWPLCNGQVVPRAAAVETLIEFSHRLTSGVALLAVVVLLVWAWRAFPRSSAVFKSAVASMILMIIEALVGAALVLLQLVGDNDSVWRAVVIAVHLVNTFLLLAALTLTAWFASGGAALRLRGQGSRGLLLGLAVAGTLLVGATGAITALGDTLFPVAAMADAARQGADRSGHFLVQLRIIHPIVAVVVGAYTVFMAWIIAARSESPVVRRTAWGVVALVGVQFIIGMINVRLQAPVWMQLVHLLLADLLWIVLVLFGAALLAEPQPETAPATLQPVPRA